MAATARILLGFLLVGSFAGAAFGQVPPASSMTSATPTPPAGATTPAAEPATPVAAPADPNVSPHTPATWVAIQRGHRAFLAQDFDLALASYREAAMGTPPVPAAHYFIACALRSKGDLDGAIESFRTAARLTNDSDPAVKAKALFNIAVTLQVLRRLPQARETWLEYQAWVRANASIVGFPDVAEQNIAVIDAWSQLEERVGEVRRRIADRAAQAAQPAE